MSICMTKIFIESLKHNHTVDRIYHAYNRLARSSMVMVMTQSTWLQTTKPTRGGAVTAVWQTLCKFCRPLQQWGPDYRFLCKPAMRIRWIAGNAPHKSGRCGD